MNAKIWGTIASAAAIILAGFGVTDPSINSAVQGVVAGAAGLVTIVSVIQHHKTTRNADTAAALSVQPHIVAPTAEAIAAAAVQAISTLSLTAPADETGKHDAQVSAPAPAVSGASNV